MPRQRHSHRIDIVRITLNHLETFVFACDFARRSQKRGDVVITSEREVDELCAGVSVGADQEDSHGVVVKTGQPCDT